MGKAHPVQATPDEIAQAEIGTQQMADWQRRWAPRIKQFSAQTIAAAAPDSYERRHATGMAGVDTAVRYAQAQDAALQAQSDQHVAGSARQKLAITGLNQDQATTNAFGGVAADQAVDDATTQGLGAVAAIGQGTKGTAIQGINQNAQMSAQRAAADAEQALQGRMGNAMLAGQIAGAAGGLWQAAPAGGIPQSNDFAGVTGANAMDKFLRLGTSGD